MAFDCIQIRTRDESSVPKLSYRESLSLEPITPPLTPTMETQSRQSLRQLHESYDKYLQSLPQKQKEYHHLVMSARRSANYPLAQRLHAPLLLARQQRALIESQYLRQYHPLPPLVTPFSPQMREKSFTSSQIQCQCRECLSLKSREESQREREERARSIQSIPQMSRMPSIQTKREKTKEIQTLNKSEEIMALNLKTTSREEEEDDDCLVLKHFKRDSRVLSRNSSFSSLDSIKLRISETPPLKPVAEPRAQEEEEETQEEFERRLHLILDLIIAPKNTSNEEIIEEKIENQNKEERVKSRDFHYSMDIKEFARTLHLIGERDLKRKPIAYLNARHPINEIARSIYAGVLTKKSVLDFPPKKRKQLSEELMAFNTSKRRRLSLWTNCWQKKNERNDWSLVLTHLDVSSPLSQRLIGVLPFFQFKNF